MSQAIQVIRADRLSAATAQTTGMRRMAAVAPETTGSKNLWVGLVTTPVGVASGWHHHGDCETAIYVVQGRARFSWGKGGQESAIVSTGDFLSVPGNAIHREENIGDEELILVVARSCSGVIVVNVDGSEG